MTEVTEPIDGTGNEPTPASVSRARQNEQQMSRLFVAVLLTGAFLAFMNWAWWLPVLPMLVYLAVGLRQSRAGHVDMEKFGDSLYFMGFLFTLVALVVGVGPLSPFAKGETAGADAIVSSMGTALIATIVGMSARLLILQFRHVEGDQAERIEEDSALAVAALTDELKKSTRALARLREASTKSADRHADDVRAAAARFTESFQKALEASAGKLAKAITDVCERFDTIEIPSDIVAKKLETAVDRAIAFEVPANLFSRKLDPPLDDLAKQARSAATAMTSTAGIMEDLQNQMRQTVDKMPSPEEITGIFAKYVEQFRSVGTSSQNAETAVKSFAAALTNAGKALDQLDRDLSARMRSEAEKLEGKSDEVVRDLNQTREGVAALRTALDQTVTFLRDRARR